MGVADFGPRRSGAFARRFPGTLDETTGGGKILHPREARDIVHVVEEHEAEDLPDARDRLQQIEGIGVMVLGRFDDGEFDIAQQRIVGGDERKVHFDALVHRRIGKALSDPVAVRFLGDFFPNGRQMILTVGILHVCQEFTAFACQVHAAPEQVTGGAHFSGGDIGLREHTTAQQDGDCMRVDRVVFGLATMDGLHGEGMTEDKRDTVFSTEVRKPVPGKQAFGRQDDLIMVRSDGLEQRLWGRGHVAVSQCFPGLVEDTHVHGAGVEIDPAIKRVLCGVKSH
jgi:hypothetical protein